MEERRSGIPVKGSSTIPTSKREYARNYYFSVRIGLITLKGSVFKADELGKALKDALDSVQKAYGLTIDVQMQIASGLRKLSTIMDKQ